MMGSGTVSSSEMSHTSHYYTALFGIARERPSKEFRNSRSGKGPTAYVYPHQSSDNNSGYLSRSLSHQYAAAGFESETDRSGDRHHYRYHIASEISGSLLGSTDI